MIAAAGIEPVWYAVIASIVAAITPLLTAWMHRQNKAQDWKRQDEVADRLLKANAQVVNTSKVIDGKLDAIHVLTNGTVRAGLERELDDARAKLVMLRIIAGLQKGAVDPDAQGLIEDTKKKIARIEKALADHERQTVIAEDHIESAKP